MYQKNTQTCFIPFQQPIDKIELPSKFTFPFYYEPHDLAKIAVEDLKNYLRTQTEWIHNFGLNKSQKGLVIGKMFGVLVVQNKAGELGYLAAFSGKLANSNHWSRFVPPVFDLLAENSFFIQEEEVLNSLNAQLEALENAIEYRQLIKQVEDIENQAKKTLHELETALLQAKQLRHEKRNLLSENDVEALETLRKESVAASLYLKSQKKQWKEQINLSKVKLQEYECKIKIISEKRKNKSNTLQRKIFEHYTFLNQAKESKSLYAIFTETTNGIPPAGAGECAAPKLLHYCFANDYKAICLAEFWWGASPSSEVRKHEQFYPACKGKCEPILKHMLSGIEIDDNPMIQNTEIPEIPILYEDDYLVVINKPSELLSVPGKTLLPSVYSIFRTKFPQWDDPIIVHRLDQSTSGIMVLAKDMETYQHLQTQFIKRRVKKRYEAILSREINSSEGKIELPLRVDLEDRPRQMVCYDYGKPALTIYETIEQKNDFTRVFFYPHTGRTHQLRVHAAHVLGLNAPIVGDDLYGVKNKRLMLHANQLIFTHPKTKEVITIDCPAEF